ncbi:hypothetical protein L7F22_031856 [Adiantum nelumboides]|nr:hypothetical protein [Adiantum nelumboides]
MLFLPTSSLKYDLTRYLRTSRLTEKVDIYSFGVVMFEVLSGKKGVFLDSSGKQIQLVDWVSPFIERGSLKELVDVSMEEKYNASSMWQVIEVGMACVQDSGDQRPSMSDVCLELKEANRIEEESSTRMPYEIPSMQQSQEDYGTISFTQVKTR